MAKTTNTTASVELVIATPAKPTIAQIAAMTKAQRAAYIAERTGAQPEEAELDLSRLAKNTADRAIAGLGRFTGKEHAVAERPCMRGAIVGIAADAGIGVAAARPGIA